MSKDILAQDELLRATDSEIIDAINYADPMILRGLLYQLTGDDSVINVDVKIHYLSGRREFYYISNPEQAAMIRAKAVDFLRAHRDNGATEISWGPQERLRTTLSLIAGKEVQPFELNQWFETTGLDPYARGLHWRDDKRPEAAKNFSVIVIGSGMSGLNAAVHLKKAGIPYTVLERDHDVGGTWRDNRYPGARLDTPSRIYTHIYGAGFPYPYLFSPQVENKKYFDWVADTFDLRRGIQFGTEVLAAHWQDESSEWLVTIRQGGVEKTLRANALISGVGFLSQPNIPKIPGIETFKGHMFHTAQWPEGMDHAGKRVAVIGTGATGSQMVPELARTTGQLTIYQQIPNWLFEVPGYLKPLPQQSGWNDRNFPYYANFARFHTSFMQRAELARLSYSADPTFKDEHALSEVNKEMRDQRIAMLTEKLAGRPDLLEKMIPVAPPMSARPIIVDSEYNFLDVILRDDCELVSEGIARITPNGIETTDGVHREFDIIVLATGFKANDYLWPMDIRGRDGLTLNELWAKDGARAYLGSMVPNFPNLFMLYGPNTNLPLGLQITDLIEMTGMFALRNIANLIETGNASVEVSEDGYQRFNDLLDQEEKLMIYADPRVNNYYKNGFGRSAVNCPLEAGLLWNWTRDPAGRDPSPIGTTLDANLADMFHIIAPRQGADLIVR